MVLVKAGLDTAAPNRCAANFVPVATLRNKKVTFAHQVFGKLVYTDLKGKFDGISLRVPVPVGSIVDVTFVASRPTTREEVNEILTKGALSDHWKHLFAVTNEPLVSSDIIGARFAAIADLEMTRVVDGTLVKVLAWYDNETSYTQTLVDHVAAVAALVNS